MAESIITADKNRNSYPSEYTNNRTYVAYCNGTVTMVIDGLKNIPSRTWTQLFTLPSGWYSVDRWVYFDMYSQGVEVRFAINPSTGVVQVYNYGDAIVGVSNTIFMATYVITI